MIAAKPSEILPQMPQSAAFDAIAQDYDQIFTHSLLGSAHRSLVHESLRGRLREGQWALELNCGTGEDAIFLASLGLRVLACDVSERMIGVARQKVESDRCGARVQFAVCANEHLDLLAKHAPFDVVLSNFGGLNCTADLALVAHELSRLVRPGGQVFLCMMGRICAWEILWYAARGSWSKALRRFKLQRTRASIAGVTVQVYYPSVRKMRQAFATSFRLESWRGIGVVLPPSWMESHLRNYPDFINLLKRVDRWFGGFPLFRGFADHILFQFVRENK